ncbi:DUF664 domain-containing protein [Phycicoccus sp. Soil748]|uniref:mycothiol transferase n=1 Tax=Phycicoccus sp. Soil748 TaxID=1736397 RepID=UPI000702A30E|nr:DUF664 domain-containing protein [Phycicoccus sp. Soil748]KRE56266.1 mini-circle protein [Phycicoccus sp. Soil748]
MDTTSRPWEPPFAGTEEQAVLGALDRLRATFRWKADGLDAQGLRTTVGASSLTLAGLLKHLAVCEDHKFAVKLAGAPMDPVWDDNGWDEDVDWELTSAVDDPPEKLYDLYDQAVARARARVDAALADGGLAGPVVETGPHGRPANLRRLVLDMVEEYGRHTGHADLLREAVDGRVGEDPPDGWQPVSGDGWRWPQR